jgi:GT2 family glycosyltransferase
MQPSVSIILLNWNSAKHTIECLDSLSEIEYENYKITIIDNNSNQEDINILKEYLSGKNSSEEKPDGTRRGLAKEFHYSSFRVENYKRKLPEMKPKSVTLVENNSNDGFPGGCNIGIRNALKNGEDYVLLLNNDVVVDRCFLTELVQHTELNGSVGIAGSKIYEYDDPDRIQSIGGDMRWWMFYPKDYARGEVDDGSYSEIKKRDFVWATSQLIDTQVFREVGLLDEEFFFGIEEYDLCDRAKANGWDVLFIPSSKVWHKGGASSKRINEFTETRSLINKQTGLLDWKLVRHALRKHYGDYIWTVPFILRYIWVAMNYVCRRVKGETGRNNI